MTQVNQSSESAASDTEIAAPSNPDSSGNGSNALSEPSAEDLTPEEEQQLAGFNPATPQLISEEYRFKQDEERAIERPLSERASLRLGAVVALVGGGLGAGSLLWFGFLQPRAPVRSPPQPSTPPTPTPSPFNETAHLKSRLAFQDQQHQLQPAARTATPKPAPPETVARPERSSPTPLPPPVVAAPPPPVPMPPPRLPNPPMPMPISPPETMGEQAPVDPFERWAQLAEMGQQRSQAEVAAPSQPMAMSDSPTGSAELTEPLAPAIPVVTIGITDAAPDQEKLEAEAIAQMSPGMVGILQRSASTAKNRAERSGEVAIGTSVKAQVILPMIWAAAQEVSPGAAPAATPRFTVELTEALLNTNGMVALPAGTLLVVEPSSVGPENHLVSASAIALVYRDRLGQIQQQTLPPESLQIRGAGNRPLVAQRLDDFGPAIARQDLLIGVLSSLSRVGGVVNQPRTQSSTVTTSGGVNQSTSTTSADPEIWAAALEGFFNPVAERIAQRSDQTLQDLRQRPPIQFIAEGMEVSVVVNSFLEINR